MKTIGFRVSPKSITFAIFDTESRRMVNIEKLCVPAALTIPEQLKYVRNNVLDILNEYQISKAGIRTTETKAQSLSIRRIEIEAIIQEAFASSSLENYVAGQIASFSKLLKIQRTDFKKYVSGELNYEGATGWKELKEEQRESVFAAIGAENV